MAMRRRAGPIRRHLIHLGRDLGITQHVVRKDEAGRRVARREVIEEGQEEPE